MTLQQSFYNMVAERDTLKQQRDQLCKALEAVRDSIVQNGNDIDTEEIYNTVYHALAATEGD